MCAKDLQLEIKINIRANFICLNNNKKSTLKLL